MNHHTHTPTATTGDPVLLDLVADIRGMATDGVLWAREIVESDARLIVWHTIECLRQAGRYTDTPTTPARTHDGRPPAPHSTGPDPVVIPSAVRATMRRRVHAKTDGHPASVRRRAGLVLAPDALAQVKAPGEPPTLSGAPRCGCCGFDHGRALAPGEHCDFCDRPWAARHHRSRRSVR